MAAEAWKTISFYGVSLFSWEEERSDAEYLEL